MEAASLWISHVPALRLPLIAESLEGVAQE